MKKGIELSPEMKKELMVAIKASDLYLEYQFNGYNNDFEATSDEIKRILDNFSLAFISDTPLHPNSETKLTPLELAKYFVNEAFLEKTQMYTQYGNPPPIKDDFQFVQMFETAKIEIINYLKGARTDFPKNDLQGLFYFTDSHLDEQRQVKTALQIIMQCYYHCDSRQKKIELENGVVGALL